MVLKIKRSVLLQPQANMKDLVAQTLAESGFQINLNSKTTMILTQSPSPLKRHNQLRRLRKR